MAKPGRPGAGNSKKKGPQKGTGGHGRKSLEGKGPTPKAEDRSWHVAGKRKAAQERYIAAGGKSQPKQSNVNRAPRGKAADDTETVTGRNSVLEAMRAKIPATAFYIAQRVEMDDRVKEMLSIATHRDIPVLEVTRQELDRMAGFDGVHQGVALKVPPYEYAHPQDLLEKVIDQGQTPLFVALDGVTDPRNLGACMRTADAAGAQAVIVPRDRSASLTPVVAAAAAGAAETLPLIAVTNLARAMEEIRDAGVWIVGAAGESERALYDIDLTGPIAWALGAEGEGLRRLTREKCDRLARIPLHGQVESLNVSVAAGVCLFETLRQRQQRGGA